MGLLSDTGDGDSYKDVERFVKCVEDAYDRHWRALNDDMRSKYDACNEDFWRPIWEAVTWSVLEEREKSESALNDTMMSKYVACNEDFWMSTWEAVNRLVLEECERTDKKFVQSDKVIQDRFCARRGPARRAPAIKVKAKKIGNRQVRDRPRPAPSPSAPVTQSRTRRRPRSSQSGASPSMDTGWTCRPTRGWPLREICWMQRLAWRRSPRRDPAPAIKANAKKIGNRQDTVRSRPAPSLREICWMQRLAGLCSPIRDPGLRFRIGPGPDYLGGHFFGV